MPPILFPICRTCGSSLTTRAGGVDLLCPGCLLELALAPPESNDNDGATSVSAADNTKNLPSDPTVKAQHAKATVPSRFAHYEIVTTADGQPVELGRGAMGTTYRATDTILRCAVALKVVNPTIALNERARVRFLREARAAASLRHPHVAGVFFFGEQPDNAQPFYAMELVEGETLEAWVRRTGGLPVATVLEIGLQVAAALSAAEARGLMHRDLKPANLMLVEGEIVHVKVIDFGLAKAAAATPPTGEEEMPLTRSEDFVGTPAFASPEQFVGDKGALRDVDARSDFYALGATLWYALTGRVPSRGATLAEIRERQLHGSLPVEELYAARVPSAVVRLLHTLLSPDPAGRPQNSRALMAALADCRQPPHAGRPSPRVGSTRGWAAGFLGVLLLGAALLVGLHQRTGAVARQGLAQQQQLTALQAQLQQQTQLISLINAKIERDAPLTSGGAFVRSDPAVAAQGEVAWERGVQVETLREQLASERADVRQILVQIDRNLTAAHLQTEHWQHLKRAALTRWGEGEYAAGHYLAALDPYQQALDLVDPAKQPLDWCEAASRLEAVLRRSARYPEAASLAQQVVERRTALQGPEHPATLKAIHDQALLVQDQGDATRAEALFRRVLEVQERTLGSEHPDTLSTVGDLSYLLRYRAKYAEAEALGRRCLETCERTLGKDHPATLRSLNSLAAILYDEGLRAEAVVLTRRCLEGRERVLGPDHPDTIITVNNLAVHLQGIGNLAEAEALLRRALGADERVFGPDNPLTIKVVNNLGGVLQDKGDYVEAEALGRRSLETAERVLGPDHFDTLINLSNLAQLIDAKGDLAAAEPLYLQAQTRMERALPPQDAFRLDLEHYFSLFREKQSRLAEALVLATRVAEGSKGLPEDSSSRRTYEQHFQTLQAKVTPPAESPLLPRPVSLTTKH